jgi:hypothetical protein
MIMRSSGLLTLGVLLLVAFPASSALGATKKKTPARPTITSVAPLKLGVGDMLTIRGTNFRVGKQANVVAFKRDGAAAVFVKAAESTRTRMKVIVPASIRKSLTKKAGVAQPTRFRMRVLARRFSKSYTPNRLSPTIVPSATIDGKASAPVAPAPTAGPGASAPAAPPAAAAAAPSDCDADGAVDSVDVDDDNDDLSDAFETILKTNPCAKDTDGDSLEDGWEYYSAIDLNSSAAPYPGARPYPNPLFKDAEVDHDGDGLLAYEEHALWVTFGNRALPLSYSDGTQFTGPLVPAPTDPANMHLNISSADGALDDDYLSDDEKDADGDRLGNWDETHGRTTAGYWKANYPEENPQFTLATYYQQPDYLNPDSDADGILDGDDDQDHDDLNNVGELGRISTMVHPFNPCLPDWTSRTCPRYLPPAPPFYAPFDEELPEVPPVPWARP